MLHGKEILMILRFNVKTQALDTLSYVYENTDPDVFILTGEEEQARIQNALAKNLPIYLKDGTLTVAPPQPNKYSEWSTQKQAWVDMSSVSMEAEKASLLSRLQSRTDYFKDQLMVGYSTTEIESFYKQEAEAERYDGTPETAPSLSILAAQRGVQVNYLVSKVKEKSALVSQAVFFILGQSQKLESEIKMITEVRQLLEVEEKLSAWNPLKDLKAQAQQGGV